MSTAKHNKRPDKQHLIGMGCMAVAAILFPVKDNFIKAQDERVPILLAIASSVGIFFLACGLCPSPMP